MLNPVKVQGLLVAAIGLIILLLTLVLAPERASRWDMAWSLAALAQTLGIALVGFGLFAMILDAKNWRAYFGERLREIVLEQDYLDGLDSDMLRGLQVKIMKALFRDPDIDREGSFLNYFHQSLHRFIADPYREDVSSELVVESVAAGQVTIFDCVHYTCRRSGDSIQSHVRWGPDPYEWMNVRDVRISVQFPQHHERMGEWELLYNSDDGGSIDDEEFPMEIPLKAYGAVDRLRVKVEARYEVRSDHFQYWQMAHPTRSFEFTLAHPMNHEVQVKPFVLHHAMCHISRHDRLVRVKYDSWMLPMSGVAWMIRPAAQTDDGTV